MTHNRFAVLLLALLVAAVGCRDERAHIRSFGGDAAELLDEGRELGRVLVRSRAESLDDGEIVALGYLERSRLGFGSPFRLAEYALADRRMDARLRTAVAYAILAETLAGRGYEVDSRVLNGVRMSGRAGRTEPGAYHLALIQETIDRAPAATAGEHTVRMAYQIAAAEGTVTGMHDAVVAHAAAFVADRRRAREDAVALLRAASAEGRDPLVLMTEWRAARRFAVESPAMRELSGVERVAEAEGVPELATQLRVLRYQLGGTGAPVRGHVRKIQRRAVPRLSSAAAERLAALAEALDYPPQAPVAVALLIHRESLADPRAWDVPDAALGLIEGGWNEERFAAAAAPLLVGDGAGVARVGLVALQAAVFLRAWNQEEVWMPGDGGPSRRDVETRFGLERITFDEVPDTWRPYLLNSLDDGLGELQRLLPTISFRGLAVRFGEVDRDRHTLAIHDPRTRTLVLPPRTGAGTIAHEVGHDLDWQLARRRYGTRGYATDLSVAHGRADRIATSVAGLSGALVPPPGGPRPTEHETRPTEIFARGFDWFIAAALAREGRTGGAVTSFQEPAVTGYGSTRGPDVRGDAPLALFTILDGIVPVPAALREWTVATHGPARPVDVADGIRQLLSAGRTEGFAGRLEAIVAAHGTARRALDRSACRASSDLETLRTEAAAMRVLDLAGEAAVRNAVRATMSAIAADRRLELPAHAVDDWVAWRFGGAPATLASAHEAHLRRMMPLVDEGREAIERMRGYRPHDAVGWIDPLSGYCAVNPFHVPGRPF